MYSHPLSLVKDKSDPEINASSSSQAVFSCYICVCVFLYFVAFLLPGFLLHQATRHQVDFKKSRIFPTVESQALFCLGSLSAFQSGSWWQCFWRVLLLWWFIGSLTLIFLFSLQEAEWHCDEFTKGACFSRGKSEVGLSDTLAFEMSLCYIALSNTRLCLETNKCQCWYFEKTSCLESFMSWIVLVSLQQT